MWIYIYTGQLTTRSHGLHFRKTKRTTNNEGGKIHLNDTETADGYSRTNLLPRPYTRYIVGRRKRRWPLNN